MTGRILASFLGVLVVVIAAVIVPLGLIVTAQQRHDFSDSARTAARGYASLAEEQLDDRASPAALPRLLHTAAAPQDAVAVIDRAGTVVATVGTPPSAGAVDAVRAGRGVGGGDDRLLVTVPIGDASRAVGTVILSRDQTALHDRARALWLALAAAAAVALLIGAVVGQLLGRWITRPLRSLVTAAQGIGAGRPDARADHDSGPEQVREVAHAFNDMADRVASLLETQRGMTAEVSHQLRTPLAALRLRLELLADDVPGPARGEVAAMLTETNRLARLVDGLLAVARAEATKSQPQATDLSQVVADRLDAWTPIAAERGITLDQDGADTRPVVAALTPGHLDQILDNLLANAIEAVRPGGAVTVTLQGNDGHVLLRVEDTGPGIDADQQAHAFDAFTTDRGGRGGTGLGLAIVGRLVATDHGTATLQTRPGGGTRAEIRMQPAIRS